MALRRIALGTAAMVACVGSNALAERGGFVISQDLGQNAFGSPPHAGVYDGPVTINPRVGMDYRGVSFDGGYDAYDNAGFLIDETPARGAGLSVHRRADALVKLNVFRWIDTYANDSESAASISVGFFTTLGAFGDKVIKANEPLRYVSFADGLDDGTTPTKPAVAMLHGNNRWALDHVAFDDDVDLPGDTIRRFSFVLQPGESATVMFADFLAFSPDELGNGLPVDVMHAMDRSAGLLLDPSDLFADLPRGVADRIVNWTVPGPGTIGAFGVMLVAGRPRRRGS